ncbi:pyridoxamine 5'-phosphate oxidase family protein [Halobacillus sp. Nhm2S1]|uniref:pyridoxamine 5'-phosphate oxidase family protein n=1 Tax=Halobacillus sp. Nhm2S1 TaxID=2866716 RepID=UPI001C73B764|nr:pyridoxamine 5'-phosphate oxidase family protein [Halobacillus sp. Nhm2S1]MBX0358411.1 pyridoxamine 5'-phosphate oxidase family protein [Halobacillus sp. Nhm2S1]
MFQHVIKNEEELRAIIGEPSELVKNKVIHHLDENCKEYIKQSPFLTLATSDADGNCDVSPRGDEKGFVHILNDSTLIIPERPGNKRVDSMKNLLSNPHAGLIFFIPGMEETLRVNGRACLLADEDLLEKMAHKGKVPTLGIAVEVEECFLHCAKAFNRSGLWDKGTWLEKEERPSATKILTEHARLPDLDEEAVTKRLNESYRERLY